MAKKRLVTQVDEETEEAIGVLAREESRTVSAMAYLLIKEALSARIALGARQTRPELRA